MAEEDKTREQETSQPKKAVNGAAGAASDQVDELADDAVETYAKAKQELNDAMARLRAEIARFDMMEAQTRARTWVEKNPALAVFMAVGAGMVVGRLVSHAVSPKPPTLADRLRAKGNVLAHQARDYSDVLAGSAAAAGGVLAKRAENVGEEVSRRARELGDLVSERAADLASESSRRASEYADELRSSSAKLGSRLSEQGESVARSLKERVHEVPERVQDRAGHGRDAVEHFMNAAKTVATAVAVKKVTDWMRKIA